MERIFEANTQKTSKNIPYWFGEKLFLFLSFLHDLEVEKFEEMRAKHEKKKELKKKLVEKNKKPQILAAKRIE